MRFSVEAFSFLTWEHGLDDCSNPLQSAEINQPINQATNQSALPYEKEGQCKDAETDDETQNVGVAETAQQKHLRQKKRKK